MEFARIKARGRTTIPKRVREAAGLRAGDVVAFEVVDEHVVVLRLAPGRDDFLRGLSRTLSEWDSPEDEVAWRDL